MSGSVGSSTTGQVLSRGFFGMLRGTITGTLSAIGYSHDTSTSSPGTSSGRLFGSRWVLLVSSYATPVSSATPLVVSSALFVSVLVFFAVCFPP